MDKQEVIGWLARAHEVEARSAVTYLANEADLLLAESSPEARALFAEIQATTRDHGRILGDRLLASRGQIDLDSYDFSLMRYNYVTIDAAMPRLRDGLEAVIRGLDEGAAAFAGVFSELEALLREMADRRRRQLDRVVSFLEARAKSSAPPAEAPPADPTGSDTAPKPTVGAKTS